MALRIMSMANCILILIIKIFYTITFCKFIIQMQITFLRMRQNFNNENKNENEI